MRFGFWRLCAVGVVTAVVVRGQTQVDLRSQTRNVDFTSATSTRPVKVGPSLPGTCNLGEIFFNTGASLGGNLYLCGATGTWASVSTAVTGTLPQNTTASLPATCTEGDMRYVTDATYSTGGWRLYTCGSPNTWVQSGIQADGTGYLTVSCAAPSSCLVGPNTAVLPTVNGPNEWTGANDFSTASVTAPFKTATTAPTNCDPAIRELYLNTTSNAMFLCTATDTWTALGSPHHSELLYQNSSIAAVAADGSTQVLDSFVIPAGTLQVGDVIEIEANFARTGSAGPITFGVSFGGGAVTHSAATGTSAVVFSTSLVVAGAASEIWGGSVSPEGGAAETASVHSSTAAEDITSAITISLTQNGTGPDTGAIGSWFIKVTK